MPKAKTGRPTKMTPEAQAKIVEALETGNFRQTSCKYAGVSYRAFKDWLAMGLVRFVEQITVAA